MYEMESQKILNLLNDADSKSSKFEAGKRYLINDQNNTKYCEGNEKDSSIRAFRCINSCNRRYNSCSYWCRY